MARCKAKNAKGDLCGAPESMVDPVTGLCPSHVPGAKKRLSEIGHRGGEATKRKFGGRGLPRDALGPLESIHDAQRWLRLIAQAVGERMLTHSEGQSMTAAVREWVKAEDARVASEDLATLKAQISEVREGIKGTRKLEVIP